MKSERYLEDAKSHIASAAPAIVEGGDIEQRFQAVVMAAVGMEKLLKHIILRVNPAFILKSHDFDSVALYCHKDEITASDRLPDLLKKASPDVITLKASIQRASLFSKSVKENAQFIHALADMRDIALHRACDELDPRRLERLLCRDLFGAIQAIASELAMSSKDFFGREDARLALLSATIIKHDNFKSTMEALLEKHRAIWAQRSGKDPTVAAAKQLTATYLAKRPETAGCLCPACDNVAVASLEPDYDYDYDADEGKMFGHIAGVYVTQIQCLYCALRLDDYDQIKFVKAEELLNQFDARGMV